MKVLSFEDQQVIPHNFIQQQSKERIGDVFFVDYVPNPNQPTAKVKIELTHHIICLLKQGTKYVHSPSNLFKISSNQGFILQKGYYLMSEHILDGAGYESFLVFFDNQQVKDFLRKYDIQVESPNNRLNPTYPLFQFKLDDAFHSFVSGLKHIIKNPALTVEMATLKLEELFMLFLEREPDFRYVLHAILANTENMHFVRNVSGKLFDPVSLDELAFLNNMSLSTFKRKFKEQFGDTPGHYIKSKRMEKAASLLTYSGKTPSEIYMDVGYQSLSSFIDAFKSVHKITPAKYKRSHQPQL